MLYTMLCNIICNVLRNMQRAKTPPSFHPFPGLDQPKECQFIKQLLGCFALIIREGHAMFQAGPIGSSCWSVRGVRRRSAGFDSSCCPIVLGWKLCVLGQQCPASCTQRTLCRLPSLSSTSSSFSTAWNPCTRRQSWHRSTRGSLVCRKGYTPRKLSR
jgi:hypothetical protein